MLRTTVIFAVALAALAPAANAYNNGVMRTPPMVSPHHILQPLLAFTACLRARTDRVLVWCRSGDLACMLARGQY